MSANPLAGHSRDSIVSGFAALRTVTDPKGHALLAVLEEEALWLHDRAIFYARLIDSPSNVAPIGHSVRVPEGRAS